jgi:flagellar motor switch protein FliM
MIFDEYVQSLVLPTQLLVLSSPTLGGTFLIDVDLGLAGAMIDRILGGAGRIPADRREPTAIESDLIGRIVDDLIPAMVEGWSHLATLEPTITERAFSPSLLRVAAPSHVVAVMTYEVRLGGASAPLTICLPHQTLEPILDRLSATAWYAQPERGVADGSRRDELTASLQQVNVPLTAILGDVELSVGELVDLQVGDVIRLADRAADPIRLTVMDQAAAWARPGRVGDRLALRLISPLQPVEA